MRGFGTKNVDFRGMLENKGGELVVHREVRYIRGGQADLDRAYGWGMEWTRGRK